MDTLKHFGTRSDQLCAFLSPAEQNLSFADISLAEGYNEDQTDRLEHGEGDPVIHE